MEEPMSSRPQTQWDDYADRLRERLPAAPEGLLSAYVTWAPWIAIVFGVLGLLGLLTALGVMTAFGPMGYGYLFGSLYLFVLVAAVASVLEIVGGYLMRQMKRTGWWLLAVGLIVGALSNLLSSALFGLLITLAIVYVHLQVKPRYT